MVIRHTQAPRTSQPSLVPMRHRREPDWYVHSFHERVTCRLLGHRFTKRKLHGWLCRRCYAFRPD